MYAYSSQTVDVRDALVECSTQDIPLDWHIAEADKCLSNDKYRLGYNDIRLSHSSLLDSMSVCDADII